MMQPTTTYSSNRSNVLHTFFKCKLVLFATIVLSLYTLVALLTKMGLLANNWATEVGGSYEAPSWVNWLGTDLLGRSVVAKIIQGVEVAMSVGIIVSIATITIGVMLGIIAGYFGGFLDECIVWLYTVLTSIPRLVLLMVIAFILGKGILSVYIALTMVSWIDICRLVRGEVMRHKSRDYIQAAAALGASNIRKLCVHILPNIASLIIVQVSIVFQSAIKTEVVLSYLGLGVQDKPSWGLMISDAKTDILRGIWWELTFATLAMFILILAFNIMADALRDALDPKLKGR